MAVSIYTDRETNSLINEIRKKNSNFNFSSFVKEALIKYSGIEKHLSEADILKNKRNAELEIKNKENEVEFWDNKLIELKAFHESQKIAEREAKQREEERKDILAQAKENIKETFKEECGREMTESEYLKYTENRDTFKNIWAFIDDLNLTGEQTGEQPSPDASKEVDRILKEITEDKS